MSTQQICYAIVYLAEAVIAWLYFEYLFPRRRKLYVIVIAFLLAYAGQFFLSLLETPEVNLGSFFLLNFGLLLFLYQCSFKTAVLHTALLTFLMSVSETLTMLLFQLFGLQFNAYSADFTALIAAAIGSKLLYLVLANLLSRIARPNQFGAQEPKMMALFCLLPLFSVLLSAVVVFIGNRSTWDEATGGVIAISAIAILAANILITVLYHYLQKTTVENLSLQLSVQKESSDLAYYRALSEQYEAHRVMLHDMNHHFSVIDAMAREANCEGIEAYLAELNRAHTYEQKKFCNDPILNAVLCEAMESAKAKGVALHYDIRENGKISMDAPSITSLFGNLLSNAVEAASASAAKQAELTITINNESKSFTVCVINSCDQPPVPDGKGAFLSRKADGFFHGLGTKSIRRVIKANHGIQTNYYDNETKQFHAVIQFPA